MRSRQARSSQRTSRERTVSNRGQVASDNRRQASAFPTKLVVLGVLIIAIIGIGAFAISHLDFGEHKQPGTVHFLAVGDNAPNEVLGAYADAQVGAADDWTFDYRPLFAPVADYVKEADLAYVVQETHVGGILDGGDIGPEGYPSFNTTDEMAAAIVETGFDLVASATNHSYDWGNYGALEHSCEVWNGYDVAFTGTAASPEDAEKIPVVECNGIAFALLSYTYGINSFDPETIGEYKVNVYSEERLRADVPRARELADVVIVAMHWGDEYVTEPNGEQLYYAQLLADLGVDIIIGSHPHAIQPMTWLEGRVEETSTAEGDTPADGEQEAQQPHRTLVCYSVANFCMQYTSPPPITNLEGMVTCDFVREEVDGPVTIQNVVWTPLVFHNETDNFAVWAVKDYTDDLAKRNYTYREIDDPKQWLIDQSLAIVNSLGDDFVIDYGQLGDEDGETKNA